MGNNGRNDAIGDNKAQGREGRPTHQRAGTNHDDARKHNKTSHLDRVTHLQVLSWQREDPEGQDV